MKQPTISSQNDKLEKIKQKRVPPIYADIVLLDIISYSKLSLYEQYDLVVEFSQWFKAAMKIVSKSNKSVDDVILGTVNTGDGFFTILQPDKAGYGPIFALALQTIAAKILDEPYFKDFFSGIKIAVHHGRIFPYMPLLDNKMNFIGDGMNECSRLLEQKPNFKAEEFTGFYSNGYVAMSLQALEKFESYMEKHEKFSNAVGELSVELSDEFIITDKHDKEYQTYLLKSDLKQILTCPSE